MKYLWGAFILLAAEALVGLVLLYSGVISVAASQPHAALTRWVLDTGKERSIRRHAADVRTPSLELAPQAKAGFVAYAEMCVTCHGAPGVERSAVGEGLRPTGPNLAESARHMQPQELFWVVKNGIKMTGMPAWGETHSDQELWEIVAFLEQLPSLSHDDYQAMIRGSQEAGHEHGDQRGGSP